MSPSGLQSPSQPPPTSPSTLAGSGCQRPDGQSPATPTPGGEDSGGAGGASPLKEAIQKLRSAEMDMMEMAGRFPAAASPLRQATTGIRAALRAIITNPGQPEPQAPSIGG